MPQHRALSPLLGLVTLLAACAAAPLRAPDGLLFWRVSRVDGAGGSAHLLGSMHLAQEALILDPAIERALADADAIALEVAPAELEPKPLLELVISLGQLPAGQSLSQLVSADTLRLLDQRVAKSDVPLAVWQRWEPWLVTMMLANEELASAGFTPEAGVEPQLTARGATKQKPTRGLETAREQIERFDTLPLATQELLLRETLASRKQRQSEETLENAWRRGDLAALERAIFSTPTGEHAVPFFEAIYFARNRSFAQDVAQLVDAGGRWFVTLGAGHMVGEQGVPQLLAARGYRVERVPKTAGASAAQAAAAAIAPASATPEPEPRE